MTARDKAIRAHRALLNNSGKLSYFEARGISAKTIRTAWVGYDAASGAFTYPCIGKGGGLLGIHYKSERRDEKCKRRQWWGAYAEDLPRKKHGKRPNDPAKVIPFGLESLEHLKPGSCVVLCCGEEDALSVRQAGYTGVSQAGAGLLEPVYAREFAGLKVLVFYDAGEEREARQDALKLLETGAKNADVVEWPEDSPHGSDINSELVKDAEGFEGWLTEMIGTSKSPASAATAANRGGEPDAYIASVPEPQSWPQLAEEALCGLAGELVEVIEPHTEADPVAVLASLLAAFGNAVGRGAFFRVGADLHHLKLNIGLVGDTSKGRKGMSWGYVRDLMHATDKSWTEERVLHGLSSGEGLIYAVRNRVEGENQKGEKMVVDEGVEDKRLLVLEAELAGVLKVMSREGNTLSPIIRQAWDDGALQTLTKNSPMKASEAHVSIIGHITKPELLRYLTDTEAANGFANRFIWFMARRSKELPFGGEWHKVDTSSLLDRLVSALEFGSAPVEITWEDDARGIWREVYGPLSEGKPGLFGAIVGRAEAQVVRLAALYAVMGESLEIGRGHLLAALALWDYAEQSARYVFGEATGDPVADRILEALVAARKDGMTRTEISRLFGRNRSSERIARALRLLLDTGRVHRKTQKTGGRQAERWFAA